MAVRIQFRRGTAAQWSAINPVLAQGEMGLELNTGKFKIGNGINNWNDLDYTTNLSGIDDIPNVVAVNPADGSLLIYDSNINKWVASTTLDKQDLDGGHF